MAPAVAPSAEVGRAATSIGCESGGDLGEAEIGERGFNDHLAGELHTRGAEVEVENGFATEGADAAVEVADWDAEEEAAKVTQDGISQIFVKRRHGSGLDFTAEAVAHDEVVALLESFEEMGELTEIVGCVGVGHENIFAAG